MRKAGNINNTYNLPPSTCKEDENHCWIKDDKGDIKREACKPNDKDC